MLKFHLLNYIITVDPRYALEFLNEAWAKEPIGAMSITLTSVGILITLSLKLLDLWWDMVKERAREGKLKIELEATSGARQQPTLMAVLSNVGREPIVVRDIGYGKPRFLGRDFIPVEVLDSPLPHALNARSLVRIPVTDDAIDLNVLLETFRVKDSLGKIWEAPEGEIRKARRQLRHERNKRKPNAADAAFTPEPAKESTPTS